MAGTTVSLRYWPVAPQPPPWTSIRVVLEPTTRTLPFAMIVSPVPDSPIMPACDIFQKFIDVI
jgi:hypothetical protein